MPIFRSSERSRAAIKLIDAENLSEAARSFGAHSTREARRRPGGFDRPDVGDPYYFSHKAQAVLRRAIKGDEELKDLYLDIWGLSNDVQKRVQAPYPAGGPSLESAEELVAVTTRTQELLAAKDLRITVEGRWHTRAINISTFALRVIDGTREDAQILPGLRTPGLYPGLGTDHTLNTSAYWYGVLADLQPAPQHAQ